MYSEYYVKLVDIVWE